MRYVDLALRGEKVVLALQIQLFDLQFRRFQIELCAQDVDGSFEECQRGALNREMSAKFAIASVHCSLDGDLPAKIVRACAEQTDEIAKLIDRCGSIAAKIRAKPARRVSGECGLAAQDELVALLSNIKLLKFDLAVVNRCADHDGFGCAIVPRGRGQFSPERCSYAVRLGEVSTESEVGGVK